jgi:aryl-alcohol dehydrogenase-like predicted oxidoreductase
MEPGQDFDDGDHRAESAYFSDENIKRVNNFLDTIKPVADKHDATLAQLTIQWTINQPGITIALVGARNQEQAIQNAKAADIDFSDDELAHIDQELEKLELVEV